MSAIDPRMRDTRPVPLVGIKAIERMFLRQIDTALAEGRLAVAVVCQAMVDCAASGPIERADAQGFLRGWRLDAWAGLVGLSPDFVRDVALQTWYLAPESFTGPFLPAATDAIVCEPDHMTQQLNELETANA